MQTNNEGMTLIEWLDAAFLGQDGQREYTRLSTAHRLQLEKAWEDGEDPGEWVGQL